MAHVHHSTILDKHPVHVYHCGTFNGRNNGEFVMSQNSPGTEGKVMYKKGLPNFAKQIFSMFPFGRK
jgi:hypothetical protein